MAKVTITDFYFEGRHYDSKTFELNMRDKNDIEISKAFARKLAEELKAKEIT